MKTTKMIKTLLFAGALGMGMIGHAMAETRSLHGSGLNYLPANGSDRYGFQVTEPTRVAISSRGIATEPAHNHSLRVNARLLDSNGRVIAEATPVRGHFAMQQTLEPGNYVLEVYGTSYNPRRVHRDRYELQSNLR